MRITIEHQYERKNNTGSEIAFRLYAEVFDYSMLASALKEIGILPPCESSEGSAEIANLKGQLERESKFAEELKGCVAEIEAHKLKLQADIDRLLVANGKLEQQLKETHGIMRATDARLEVQLKRNQQLSDENAKMKQWIFKNFIHEVPSGFLAQWYQSNRPSIVHPDRASAEAAILKVIGIDQ